MYASTASAEAARPGREVADKPGGKPDSASKPTEGEKKDAKKDEKKEDKSAGKDAESKPSASKPEAADGEEGEADEDNKEIAKIFSAARAMGNRPAGKPAPEGGNGIYKIDPNGFVTEAFRGPVMILALIESKGTIYVGTGNEGRVYAVTPGEERTTMLVKLEPQQVTSLLRLEDGQLVVGTANAALLARISDRYAAKGTLISTVLDAGQIVKWGRIDTEVQTPAGTKVTVSTRSANVENEESEAWEAWSPEMPGGSLQQISSVTSRFLQYRLTLETASSAASPTLRRVQIHRIEDNRAPRVSSVTIVSAREEAQNPAGVPKVKTLVGGGGGFGGGEDGPPVQPDYYWVIKWQAADPNKDAMTYDVFFREAGGNRWIKLDKDSKEAFYIWDTRTVADGKYEVRVVASDGKANPVGNALTDARLSDPLTVDNTPPEITIDKLEPQGKDELTVQATFKDASNSLTEAAYTVDSNDEWIPLAADDDVFDSMTESSTFTIKELKPGEHRLAIRARDRYNNTRYESKPVTIGG